MKDRRKDTPQNELRRARHGDTSIGWRGWLKHALYALLVVALWVVFVLYVTGAFMGVWPYA